MVKIHILLTSLILGLLTGCGHTFETKNSKYSISSKPKIVKTIGSKINVAKKISVGNSFAPSSEPLQKHEQVGVASWYGPNFHGKKTASGTIFNQHEYTAAHPLLPMLSIVKVVNLENQRSVLVVINDRGPYTKSSYNRIIDLSHKAADDLRIVSKGTANVKVEYLYDHTQKLLARLSRNKENTSNIILTDAMVKHITQLNKRNGSSI